MLICLNPISSIFLIPDHCYSWHTITLINQKKHFLKNIQLLFIHSFIYKIGMNHHYGPGTVIHVIDFGTKTADSLTLPLWGLSSIGYSQKINN